MVKKLKVAVVQLFGCQLLFNIIKEEDVTLRSSDT